MSSSLCLFVMQGIRVNCTNLCHSLEFRLSFLGHSAQDHRRVLLSAVLSAKTAWCSPVPGRTEVDNVANIEPLGL